MAPVHQALDRFLRAHEPYPAMVIDRHHNLVSANDALGALLEGVAPAAARAAGQRAAGRASPGRHGAAHAQPGRVERSSPAPAAPARRALDRRPRARDASTTSSPATPGSASSRPASDGAAGDIVVPLRLRTAERELAFFSTISTFGSPVDITLDELMIEAFYPANAATAAICWRGSRVREQAASRRCVI